RDEPRPRSGVLRARQFIMKDSYSLDYDQAGLDHSYELHKEAYKKIFDRSGIKYFIVGASSGLMGGSGSQEFMAESDVGEDTIVLCDHCRYAVNLEIATSDLTELVDEPTRLEEVSTPNVRTIEEVSEFLNVPASRFIKSLVYIVDDEPILILIRGDHELNESKMQVRFGAKFRPAAEDEIEKIMDGTHTGFIGPVGLKGMAIYVDKTVVNQKGFISGANKDHFHLKGIDLKRDISIREIIDVSTVKAGEKCPECGHPLRIVNAIEIGHIFKLGTKYSEAMNATVLNPGGEKVPIIMGSYGIGVERILATHIEQNSDDKGIVWSKALAPYFVHIIPINVKNESVLEQAEAVYDYCNQEKISALIDDRNVGPGFKLKDADLLGMPLQIIVGEKNLKNNRLEFKIRRLQKSFLVDVNHYKEELKGTLQKIE
ncbi:MAG TPA: proline--tRNA ligase, partial [Bacteroidetes bacterium]|nr:proline--tRNA ligase [Bacteroidota bacterium]